MGGEGWGGVCVTLQPPKPRQIVRCLGMLTHARSYLLVLLILLLLLLPLLLLPLLLLLLLLLLLHLPLLSG